MAALEQQFDQKCKPFRSSLKDSEIHNGSFDCNICLDYANDPVVTLCGHLYCWPCIYKWLHVQSDSLPSYDFPQCPVCKAEISHTTVVPLYGRGQSMNDSENATKVASEAALLPPRPQACGTRALLEASSRPTHYNLLYRTNPYRGQSHVYSDHTEEVVSSTPLLNQTGNPVANMFPPFVGMFGEMVYARVFGNSQSLYTYPNSYHAVGNNSSRLRRQEMQVDKSLSRVSLFLLCCFLLCLLLF